MPVEVVLTTLTCLRCPHRWHPRKAGLPKKCPGCGSKYWNTPYTPNAAKLQTNKRRSNNG